MKAALVSKYLSGGIPALALLGAAISSYLTYTYWSGGVPFCGGLGGCAKVEASPYAHIHGIPVALLGLLSYLGLAGLGLWRWRVGGQMPLLVILALATSGTFFSAYLIYRQRYTIGAFCPWCLASALIMTAILALSLALAVREAGASLRPTPALPRGGRKASSVGR